MNTNTGEVRQFEKPEMEKLLKSPEGQAWKEIDPANLTEAQRLLMSEQGRIHLSRNSACLCGSGKRFKNCCYTGRK